MDIVLYVLAGLAALVIAVLLIPVKAMLYNDADNRFHYKIKVLFKTFDDTPTKAGKKPKSTTSKPSQKAKPKPNLDRFHKSVKEDGLLATVSDTVELLQTVLGEVFRLVRHVQITKLQLHIVCVGDDAADAALQYGRCCALVFPLAGFVHSLTTVKRRGEDIDIRCDFLGGEDEIRYDVHLSVRVAHIVAAALRFLWKESARFLPQEAKMKE